MVKRSYTRSRMTSASVLELRLWEQLPMLGLPLSLVAPAPKENHGPASHVTRHHHQRDPSGDLRAPHADVTERPCVTLGAWKAYAGEEEAASFDGYNPRARVRRAVERLLRSYPKARLVLTGHSLGGVLSTLCAFDLIAQSEVVRSAGPLTLINFAAPRMFNQAFQDAMSTLEESGRLHALRAGGAAAARRGVAARRRVHALPRGVPRPAEARRHHAARARVRRVLLPVHVEDGRGRRGGVAQRRLDPLGQRVRVKRRRAGDGAAALGCAGRLRHL